MKLKMKKLLLFMLSIVAFIGVKANDCEYFVQGNQLIPMKQTNISVTKEVLSIRMDNEGFANVEVDYTFDNLSGKTQTILMGFETPTPYFMDTSEMFPPFNEYIKDFTIHHNGRKIPFKVAVVDPDNVVDKNDKINPIDWNEWVPGDEGFGGTLKRKGVSEEDPWKEDDHKFCVYAYYFDAKFQPGINHLRHTYRYRMAVGVDYEYKLDYMLTPETRWANQKIDDFTLEISCQAMVRDFIILGDVFDNCDSQIVGTGKRRKTDYYDTPAEEFVLRDATLVFHAKDFRPSGELCLISKCNPSAQVLDFNEGNYELDPETLVYDTSNM